MKQSQILKVCSIHDQICKLVDVVKGSKFDCETKFGNGLESELLNCAISALECILQEYEDN